MRRDFALALCLLLAPAFASAATANYDYASRTQGTEVFAYDGASATQVPANATTPATVLSSTEYDAIETDNGAFHTLSTSTNNNYVHMRFVFAIDELEVDVTALNATWNGRNVNGNPGKVDGARLYAWNYATSSYTLLAQATTDVEVVLAGAAPGAPADYIGGASNDTVTLYVVTQDTKNGSSTNSLSTDYLRLTVTSSLPAPLAEWRMEQATWSGTANEVVDGAGAGYHGRGANGATTAVSSPALAGDPGTCRYGVFDGTNDYVELSSFPNLTGSFTINAWVRTATGAGDERIFADDQSNTGGYGFSIGDGGVNLRPRFFSRGVSPVSLDATSTLTANTWHFMSAVHDAAARTRRIYRDGTLIGSGTYTGTWSTDSGPASIGGEVDGTSEATAQWRLQGNVDWVRVYNQRLSAAQILELRSQTHACGAVDHFALSHDGYGIHCLAETVSVTAEDAGGNAITSYTGSIVLDTQTGKGTWSLLSGSGAFADATANDGLATYTFAAGDSGSATFQLSYPEGTTPLDVDAYVSGSPSTRDDDTEGALAFHPSGFTVTGAALPNPPPNPISSPVAAQTAGTNFTLYLAAYGTTPTDPTCGIIESYTGSKTLEFWSTYQDPASGTINVTVDGTPIATSSGAATGQSVTFASGQASVTAKYKDAGQILIAMRDASVAQPITGSSNAFVSKPADFAITAVERPDASANPGASTPAGTIFVAAGAPFRATVEARDAEGSRTPNYGNESSPEGIRLASSALVAPAGGRNGTADDGAIGNATAFSATAPAGTFAGTTFYWDEVGAIRLRASVADASYLGAGDVTGSESGTIGRFAPDHFDVAYNTPAFQTFCASGAFTYAGQAFPYQTSPVLTATARNAQGTTTQNYAGAWLRLSAGTLAGLAYSALTGTLSAAAPNAPTVTDAGAGVATIAFDTGPTLWFQRTAAAAPYDAEISLAVNVIDADGVAYPGNPARFGQPTAGNGIGWTAGKSIRTGRLQLTNANGSELVALPVPFAAQYWNGSVFVANASDACTAALVAELGLAPNPAGLSTTPTIANNPLAAGSAGLVLSAPGAGNTGYVDLVYDLSTATGAALEFLRWDWDGDGSLDDDPTARATFGIFPGDGRVIYLREVY
jgi:hypothetical protein